MCYGTVWVRPRAGSRDGTLWEPCTHNVLVPRARAPRTKAHQLWIPTACHALLRHASGMSKEAKVSLRFGLVTLQRKRGSSKMINILGNSVKSYPEDG